jgi:hypothetical protein
MGEKNVAGVNSMIRRKIYITFLLPRLQTGDGSFNKEAFKSSTIDASHVYRKEHYYTNRGT